MSMHCLKVSASKEFTLGFINPWYSKSMATLGIGWAKTREPKSVPTRLASSAPGHVKDTGTFDSTKPLVGWTLNKEEGPFLVVYKYIRLPFWKNPLLFQKWFICHSKRPRKRWCWVFAVYSSGFQSRVLWPQHCDFALWATSWRFGGDWGSESDTGIPMSWCFLVVVEYHSWTHFDFFWVVS